MATKNEDIPDKDLPKWLLIIAILGLLAAFGTQNEVREEVQFPCGTSK